MFLQPYDVLTVQEFGPVFYLCLVAVFVISFVIAFEVMGKIDSD